MKRRIALVIANVATLACGRSLSRAPADFSDDFSAYAEGAQFAEGARFGAWTVEFGGYGAVRVTDGSLELVPKQAAAASATHSVLVSGPSFTEPVTFDVRLFTGAQLRVGDLPNPWEAAWIMWSYSDPAHSYYFLPKPNGWELAKRDPVYQGGQRIMITGDAPLFRVNRWYDVRVTQRGAELTIHVDGAFVARYTDLERPYLAGRVALYTEDAAVRFDDVRVSVHR